MKKTLSTLAVLALFLAALSVATCPSWAQPAAPAGDQQITLEAEGRRKGSPDAPGKAKRPSTMPFDRLRAVSEVEPLRAA